MASRAISRSTSGSRGPSTSTANTSSKDASATTTPTPSSTTPTPTVVSRRTTRSLEASTSPHKRMIGVRRREGGDFIYDAVYMPGPASSLPRNNGPYRVRFITRGHGKELEVDEDLIAGAEERARSRLSDEELELNGDEPMPSQQPTTTTVNNNNTSAPSVTTSTTTTIPTRVTPSPSVGVTATISANAPSPSPRDVTNNNNGDTDAIMTDASTTPNSTKKVKSLAQLMEEIPLAPIPRKPIEVPTLPPPATPIEMEDLPPFKRPTLKCHRKEEARMIKVQSVINEQRYPEQLIDTSETVIHYAPTAAWHSQVAQTSLGAIGGSPSHHHLPSPSLSASRSPMTALQLSHGRTGSLNAMSGSPALSGRKQSSANLPPLHNVPNSPTVRSVNNSNSYSSLIPATPHNALMRQQSLTTPIPTPIPIRKSKIISQPIPYGRMMIKPARHSILCASSVPLTPNQTIPSWYLPTSHPCTLYITLDLPGRMDFEIKLDNVFLLPETIDLDRLKVQQRMIYDGKLECKTLPPGNNRPSTPNLTKPVVKNGTSLTLTKQTSATTGLPLNGKRTRTGVTRRRIGGHLQRKATKPVDELELLEKITMEDGCNQPAIDELDREFHKSNGCEVPFGPPKLPDVKVSIKSRGKLLVPEPAHIIRDEPVYTKHEAPSRLVKSEQQKAAMYGSTNAPITMPTIKTDIVKTEPGVLVKGGERPVFWYAQPELTGTQSRAVPVGPSILSPSNPTITFGNGLGTISLERLKPRLGGWVVKRELSIEAAKHYQPASIQAPMTAEEMKTLVAQANGTKLHYLNVLKPEPQGGYGGPTEDEVRLPLTAEQKEINEEDQSWQSYFVKKYQSDQYQHHDIAEVGDVIRLLIHVPAPPPQPKSKVIKSMDYELVIEGIRIAPADSAPPFPAPMDLYRFGTAPKEVVEADVLNTRLTSSFIPSQRLLGVGQHHWSELGREKLRREPLLFPETFIPSSEESESEDESSTSSSSDNEMDERKEPTQPRPKKLRQKLPAVVASAERKKFYEEFPQHNAEEYFDQLPTGSAQNGRFHSDDDARIDEENEEFTRSGDESDGSQEDDFSSSGSDTGGGAFDRDHAHPDGESDSENEGPSKHRNSWSDEDEDEEMLQAVGGSGSKGFTSSSSQARARSNQPVTATVVSGSNNGNKRKLDSTGYNSVTTAAYVAPEAVWAACDKCGKWRRLPTGTVESSLPKIWFCRFNPDTTHNTCSAPEEVDPDAVSVSESTPVPAAAASGQKKADPSKQRSTPSTSSSTVAASTEPKSNKPPPPSATALAAQAYQQGLLTPNPRWPTSEDVCFECEKALTSDGGVIQHSKSVLMCYGPCQRMWHHKCIPLTTQAKERESSITSSGPDSYDQPPPSASLAKPSTDPTAIHPTTHCVPFQPFDSRYWYCSDCMNLKAFCSVCHQSGTIDASKDVIRNPEPPPTSDSSRSSSKEKNYQKWIDNPEFLKQCPFANGCGRFFHDKCLFKLDRTMTSKGSRIVTGTKDSLPLTPDLVPRSRAGLLCPAHSCSTCNGSGTASTNVRDIGRTLIQCIRCPDAIHTSSKCRDDIDFEPITKRYGICENHHEGDDSDDETEEERQKRLATKQGLTMTYDKPPAHLFGSEPREESSDEEESDEEDSENEEGGEEDQEALGQPQQKRQKTN